VGAPFFTYISII